MPRHIVAKDESGTVIGVVPLYLKRFFLLLCSQNYIHFRYKHQINRLLYAPLK